MKYRLLGRSKLEVSIVGFGCMSLRGSEEEQAALIERAIALGINFFDTADLYDKGQNEVSLGKAIRKRRKELVISTKVGNEWLSDGTGWRWNPGKNYILKAADDSLRRLQTDYIDLYQLHGGTLEDPIDETIEAFETLKAQGKIRFYGISSIRPNVIREYIARSSIVSVMMQYSLLDRRPEEESLSLLQHQQIGVLARGVLAKGLLVDKPSADFLNYDADKVGRANSLVQSFSGDLRTPAQTALRFALQHPAITSAVVGIRTPAQLEDVAVVSETPELTAAEMNALRQAVAVNYYDQHR